MGEAIFGWSVSAVLIVLLGLVLWALTVPIGYALQDKEARRKELDKQYANDQAAVITVSGPRPATPRRWEENRGRVWYCPACHWWQRERDVQCPKCGRPILRTIAYDAGKEGEVLRIIGQSVP